MELKRIAADGGYTPKRNRDWDADTESKRIAPGIYENIATFDWFVGGAAHGGYLAGLICRVLQTEFKDTYPFPITLTVNYLRKVTAGPVRLAVHVLKQGKTYTTAQVTVTRAHSSHTPRTTPSNNTPSTLTSGGSSLLMATAVMACSTHFDASPPLRYHCTPSPPALPTTDQCVLSPALRSVPISYQRRLLFPRRAVSKLFKGDTRGKPDSNHEANSGVRLRVSEKHANVLKAYQTYGYAGFRNNEVPLSHSALCFFGDGVPAANIFLVSKMSASHDHWFPTLSITYNFFTKDFGNAGKPGFLLRARSVARVMAAQNNEMDIDLFDSDGRILCSSRQMGGIVPWSLNIKNSKPLAKL